MTSAPDRPEMKGRVTKGDLAGPLNRPGGIPVGEAQEAQQNSRPLDAAGQEHGFRPGRALGSQSNGHPAKSEAAPRCTPLTSSPTPIRVSYAPPSKAARRCVSKYAVKSVRCNPPGTTPAEERQHPHPESS